MRRSSLNRVAFAVVCMLILLPTGASAQQAPAETAKSSAGIVHTVVAGDTLWDLSAKYLGSPWKWTEIWEHNRFLTNPHYIYPGIQVVIVPPGPREFALGQEPASASGPAEKVAAVAPTVEAANSAVQPVAPPRVPYLDIKPEDFVRAGEFTKEAPKGIGNIQAGRDAKVGFVTGDAVYLVLRKEIPEGQMLGVYRVRGPIDSPGKRSVSGYVKYLIGVIQVGPKLDGQPTARVRKSFEDLTRADLVSEEIPAYTPVRIDPGADGIPCSVITARLLNQELASGDFIYLDQGAAAGVAVGNVFNLYVPTGAAAGAEPTTVSGKVLYAPVAKAVVVRVSPEFSTAYVTYSMETFAAGAVALRGKIPLK
jgi:LysM repeat protein